MNNTVAVTLEDQAAVAQEDQAVTVALTRDLTHTFAHHFFFVFASL